ncbi:hypothetical protein PACID_05190 [Acidipropionibacterium acidipropionici ATCC 4875]|uniref:AbiEi antitoxin C-terminal domain-containing protein n=3 Tax=Acidipropionibacterium acidipropionici TaxID=1748 RepID=K7SGI6_ACIA4|nr:hypothetical protein PACID_05190 [Acidipropionibacterium acidipropionici ATCC 4875]
MHRLALWLTHLMADDSRQVQRISDMRRLHFTYDKIKKGLRDGSLTRVRHGAVVDGPIQQTARARQLELIDATVPVLAGPRWALSHTSAVALLGLPMTRDGAESVWITRSSDASTQHHPPLIVRACEFGDDEVIDVNGLLVTTPERTAMDMARQFGFVTGTMIADAVLRGGSTPNKLLSIVTRAPRRPGNAIARDVAAFADRRSESPGESLMRAVLERERCAPTDLQIDIFDEHGRFVARCDFDWLEYGVVGEYDGPQKYFRNLKPGQSISDAIVAEKAREADIRDQGLEVVRFCLEDLRNPRAAAARLRRLCRQRGLLKTPWTNPVPLAPPDDGPWQRGALQIPWTGIPEAPPTDSP